MVRVAIHTAQFRQNDGPVTLQIPKGSQLLKVHQSGSGYWFADCLAPEKSDGLEPLELLLITDKAASVDLDLSVWSCVGTPPAARAGAATYSTRHPRRQLLPSASPAGPAKRPRRRRLTSSPSSGYNAGVQA